MEKEEIKRVLRTLDQAKLQQPEILYLLCRYPRFNDEQIANMLSPRKTSSKRISKESVYGRKRGIFQKLEGAGIVSADAYLDRENLPRELIEAINELVDHPPQFYPWPPVEFSPEEESESEQEEVEETEEEEDTADGETEETIDEETEDTTDDTTVGTIPPAGVIDQNQTTPAARHPALLRWPFQSPWRNAAVVLLAVVLFFGALLWIFGWVAPIIAVPEPTTVAEVETETTEDTPASIHPSRTPNPTQTQEMAGTLTAVSMAQTATARVTNTSTSIPSNTPSPTVTSPPTSTPTATITPTSTPSPTPNIVLPWSDDFDSGELAPEWKKLASQYTIKFENNNGWLAPISPDADCLLLSIGDESLNNFSFEMGYGSTLPGWANSNRFVIGIGDKIRVVYHSFSNESWEIFAEGEWVNFHRGTDRHPFSRHLKITASGNRYTSLLDGSIQSDIVNPDVEASGPITLQVCRYVQIDYVSLEALP